VNSKITQIY